MTAIDGARAAAQELVKRSEREISMDNWHRSSLYRQAIDQFTAAGDEDRAADMRREMIIFDLSSGQREDRYFGSKASGTRDTGERVEYPDWETDFPPQVLDYYARRIGETTNPALLARYNDLLWEKGRGHVYGRAAARAYIAACPTYYADDMLIELGGALKRSLELAAKLDDKALVKEAVDLHHDLIRRMIADQRFRPLLELADSALARAPRLKSAGIDLAALRDALKQAIQDYTDNQTDDFLLRREFLDRLVKTCKLQKDEPGSRDARVARAESFVEEAVAKGGPGNNIVAAHFYEEAMKVYLDLGGFPEVVEGLKLKIEAANAAAAETEYQTVSVPVEIPRDELQEHFDAHYKGKTTAQICALMTLDPNLGTSWDHAVSFYNSNAQDFVFRQLFGTKVMQGNLVIKNIETDEDKAEYYAIEYYQQSYRLMAGMFLDPIFDILKADHPNYLAEVEEFLGATGTISPARIALIRHGLRAFDQGEYVAALHILVFQVEGVLRDMVGRVGLPTFSYQRGPQEMRARLLTDLIDTLGQIGMDSNLLKFIDVLLNNLMGENLRNNIAHALMPEGAFGRQYVELVLLILIKLSTYKSVKAVASATAPSAEETASEEVSESGSVATPEAMAEPEGPA